MFVTHNVKIVKFVMIFAYVRVIYYIYRERKKNVNKKRRNYVLGYVNKKVWNLIHLIGHILL